MALHRTSIFRVFAIPAMIGMNGIYRGSQEAQICILFGPKAALPYPR